ncbi:MAG: response regulator [Spirochaetales bacterium]|nr:response regulator [Spirochaetales bacterium]
MNNSETLTRKKRKYKILVATHKLTTRSIIMNTLTSLNTDCYYVKDGDEGLEIISDVNFDLIIADSLMPHVNGIVFCETLKKNPQTHSIPVIIISNQISSPDINQGFNAGASSCIDIVNIENQLTDIVKDELEKRDLHEQQHILIVDDSRTILSALGKGLMQAGFRVMTAENGKKALELMLMKKPDLILSDIIMPEMDGFSYLSATRSIPEFADIPFIAMSTKNDRASMRRMVQAGAASYILKPIHIEQLIITIENILSTQFRIVLKDRERLSLEQKQTLISITSLVTALEARDPYTKGHSEAVSKMTSDIVTYMGTSQQAKERIAIGAMLHDIGKIGIKDKVLLKPGPLTKDEFEHIKKHPIIGINIVKNIPHMDDIIPIIQFHHERFDGKGYPAGLKKDNIPFPANIVAIADTYDSLTSKRPYRNKMSSGQALQIIYDNRGTQFNPDYVDIFFKFIFSKEKIAAI